jgi:hypothetical protein
MLRGPASHSHIVGLAVESVLHRLKNGFVLPACNAPIFAGCALRFDQAAERRHPAIFSRSMRPFDFRQS